MQKHLDALRASLAAHGWQIVDIEPGNGLDISEIWVIEADHSTGAPASHRLVFEGMGDLEVLAVERSYACFASAYPADGVYFSRNGRHWKQQIDDFVASIGKAGELASGSPSVGIDFESPPSS